MEVLQMISDILSIITITLCLIQKIPQILNVLKLQSSKGINIYGLMLELTSYTIMACYNFCNGYAILSYLEYPVILFQQIILIYLVLKCMDLVNTTSWTCFALYVAITGGFLYGVIPKTILTFAAPLCTPVSASSKVIQLAEILRTKDSQSISVLTWFISAFTNLTRVFTIYMDSADVTLLTNFCVSVFLSTSIMLSAIYFKNPKAEKSL